MRSLFDFSAAVKVGRLSIADLAEVMSRAVADDWEQLRIDLATAAIALDQARAARPQPAGRGDEGWAPD
jgi:hypothetical protein